MCAELPSSAITPQEEGGTNLEKDDEGALLTYGFKRANAVFTIGFEYCAATQLFAANATIRRMVKS